MQRKRSNDSRRMRGDPPAWEQEQPFAQPGWEEPQQAYGYEEQPYDDAPYEEPYDEAAYEEIPERPTRARPQPEVIATNTAVRLTCTLCAMCGLLAIFMCWAEKESRAIRHFAVQSAAVTGLHILCALVLLLISGLMGGIPFLGFLLTMVCWLCYIAVLIVVVVIRARMMLHAWRGIRFMIPGLWRTLERFA